MSNEENVYVEPPIEVKVTEGAMGVLSISTNNHNDLANRYTADQHNIDAITGLRARLLEIQNPTVAKSVNGRGYAEYYKWLGGAPSTDKTGYFVSLVQDEDGNLCITPVSTTHPNIFGVTIPRSSAAFVGNDEWTEKADATGYESSIDETYGLVCLEGAVKVRYAPPTLDIKPGDWVKPTSDGRAEKVPSTNGCYIVAGVGVDITGHYVEINLSLSASDVKKITVDHAILSDNAVDYTANGTIKKKFDEIEYEFDDIKDGTTVVGEASHSVSADDYTENGTIKEKFDGIDQWQSDIESGNMASNKAINDADGNNIKNNYYYLNGLTMDDERYCTAPQFDINALNSSADCGVYVVNLDAIKANKDNLPSDLDINDIFSIRLIVEADVSDTEWSTAHTTYQTLKVSTFTTGHNISQIYYRACHTIPDVESKWDEWKRFVSAEELTSGIMTVHSAINTIYAGEAVHANNAAKATNDQNGISITDNYYCFNGENWKLITEGNLDEYTTPGNYYIKEEDLRGGHISSYPDLIDLLLSRPSVTTDIGVKLVVEQAPDGKILQHIKIIESVFGELYELSREINSITSLISEWRRYVTYDEIEGMVKQDDIKTMVVENDIKNMANHIGGFTTTTIGDKTEYNFPIGTILVHYGTFSPPKAIGDSIEPYTSSTFDNTSDSYVFNRTSNKKDDETKIDGEWKVCGLVGTHLYLIQRVS